MGIALYQTPKVYVIRYASIKDCFFRICHDVSVIIMGFYGHCIISNAKGLCHSEP